MTTNATIYIDGKRYRRALVTLDASQSPRAYLDSLILGRWPGCTVTDVKIVCRGRHAAYSAHVVAPDGAHHIALAI